MDAIETPAPLIGLRDPPLRLVVPDTGASPGGGTDVLLIEALEAGLAGDAYDVGDRLYRWASDPARRCDVIIEYERPGVALYAVPRAPSGSDAAVADTFGRMAVAYAAHPGDGMALAGFMEGAVLAAVRLYGRDGRLGEADQLLASAAPCLPNSIHLRAAKYAVARKLSGIGLAPHLEKYVGDDDGGLVERFCEVPFARMDIDGNGDVRVCCAHWVPAPIGNIFTASAEDIANSQTVQNIRRSVVDGSFKYCNHVDCEIMMNGKLPRKSDYQNKPFQSEFYDIPADRLQRAFDGADFAADMPSYVIYGLDQTCNLSCPSCRREVITVKGEERDRFYEATERTVIPLLRRAKRLMINPSGEAFVSRPSRRILERINREEFPDLKVDIITNGTVCTKEEWQKFQHLHGMVGIIRVSTDGASAETFEKLRRGGDYDTFLSNMMSLSQMHRQNFMSQFYISFTYQLDNYLEMERFVWFGRWLGVSAVIFECLQNLGAFSGDEYQNKAVHLPHHPEFPIFREVAVSLKGDSKVWMDFDPGGRTEPLLLSEKLLRGYFSRYHLDFALAERCWTAAGVDPGGVFDPQVALAPENENMYFGHMMTAGLKDQFFTSRLRCLEEAMSGALAGKQANAGRGSGGLGRLDLAATDFLGFAWGRAESNLAGQSWRWLFGGPHGRSTVFACLEPGQDYEVLLDIHDAPIDQYLLSLRLEVNGEPVGEQFIKNDAGRIFHVAKVAREVFGTANGWVALAYTTAAPVDAGPGERGIAASAININPPGQYRFVT